jgi:nucleoside-triphosphatase THEP1
MECLSPRFVEAVRELLDSRRLLVATVAARGGGFMEETRERRDVELWTVSRENRERLPARVVAWLRDRLET